MKKLLIGLVAVIALVGGLAFAQNVSNYTEQGGLRTVVGGTLDVVSGGDLDIESGGVFSIAGTTVSSTAAELNVLDGVGATLTFGELDYLDITLGTGAASKAVVLDAGEDFTWPATGILTLSTVTANQDPLALTGVAGSAGNGGVANLTGGAADASNVGGAVNVVSGAGGATAGASGITTVASGVTTAATSGSGPASGVVSVTSGAPGGATTGIGGASGAVTVGSADGSVASGATGQGGAAGATNITGGAGGATTDGAAGAETGGAGSDVTITGGAGGALNAASTGTSGAGGDVIITPGLAGAASSGTVANDGVIRIRRGANKPVMGNQPAPQTATNTATIGVAQMLGGILVVTPTAASVLTLPSGTDLTAEFDGLVAGDYFDLHVINLGGTDTWSVTITDATDISTVGSPVIDDISTTTQTASATFRFRWTATVVWIMYRIN